ncbi:hypothetical protein ANN_25273 [Periplaneta americana]|uniref:Reverse transcriptase domain-containing protein n=1 Tax=Periplaneta americana TaxID=6978 RepID=A0ABQ8S180_PERAM|nr:hypothetical protein ANN_25273 [Periplaneta americana]
MGPVPTQHRDAQGTIRNPVANTSYNDWGDHRANHTIPPFWLDDRPPLLRHVGVRPAAGWWCEADDGESHNECHGKRNRPVATINHNLLITLQTWMRLEGNMFSGIDQIPAELIQEGGSALSNEIYKLVLAIWEKEIVPEQWKESIIVPIFKMGDKTNCSNFRGISLLLTSYKILSNILLRRLTPYVDEIIWDHQCGFRRNRSTIDRIFGIQQIMEKKWEYKGSEFQSLGRAIVKEDEYEEVRWDGLLVLFLDESVCSDYGGKKENRKHRLLPPPRLEFDDTDVKHKSLY